MLTLSTCHRRTSTTLALESALVSLCRELQAIPAQYLIVTTGPQLVFYDERKRRDVGWFVSDGFLCRKEGKFNKKSTSWTRGRKNIAAHNVATLSCAGISAAHATGVMIEVKACHGSTVKREVYLRCGVIR